MVVSHSEMMNLYSFPKPNYDNLQWYENTDIYDYQRSLMFKFDIFYLIFALTH